MKLKYKLLYPVIYSWAFMHALLPLKILYILSDILYFVVYKTVGYRRKIVRKNLLNSFPDKTPEEIKKIEQDFYHHFCDYFLETIKLLHISEEEILKRMKFTNMEVANRYYAQGKSVLLTLGHYGNWEWVPSVKLSLPEDVTAAEIYKPLKNKAVDRLFLKVRTRFGSVNIPKKDTLRTIVRMMRSGTKVLIGFIADQKPAGNSIHYWTNFLNQDTPIFTGFERIAKQTGFVVGYLDIKKAKRGYYEGEIVIISDDPKKTPENEITEKYVRLMEKTILRDPSCWLWTHKRWKLKRADFQ